MIVGNNAMPKKLHETILASHQVHVRLDLWHHEIMSRLPFKPRCCVPQIYVVMKVAFVFIRTCPQTAVLLVVFY